MTTTYLPELPALMIEDQVRAALIEDLGRAGDLTTNATIGPDMQASAEINSRGKGIIAGLPLAAAAFRLINPMIKFEALVDDGARVEKGTRIARISGPARGMLSAERVALNYLIDRKSVV